MNRAGRIREGITPGVLVIEINRTRRDVRVTSPVVEVNRGSVLDSVPTGDKSDETVTRILDTPVEVDVTRGEDHEAEAVVRELIGRVGRDPHVDIRPGIVGDKDIPRSGDSVDDDALIFTGTGSRIVSDRRSVHDVAVAVAAKVGRVAETPTAVGTVNQMNVRVRPRSGIENRIAIDKILKAALPGST